MEQFSCLPRMTIDVNARGRAMPSNCLEVVYKLNRIRACQIPYSIFYEALHKHPIRAASREAKCPPGLHSKILGVCHWCVLRQQPAQSMPWGIPSLVSNSTFIVGPISDTAATRWL